MRHGAQQEKGEAGLLGKNSVYIVVVKGALVGFLVQLLHIGSRRDAELPALAFTWFLHFTSVSCNRRCP